MKDTLLLAIIGHLVGDYLLQNDWMALNKKKKDGSFQCCIHAWLWTLSVCTFTGWWNVPIASVLFLAHFYQDRTDIIVWWMKLIGQRQFMKSDELQMLTFKIIPGLGPWSIIVVDNVWHILTLWAVWKFLVPLC